MRLIGPLILFAVTSACTSDPTQPVPTAMTGSSSSEPALSETTSSTSESPSNAQGDTSTTTPTGDNGPFRLLFRDDFDTLNDQYWQAMTHSWNGNLALFSEQSAVVDKGELKLSLLTAPEGTESNGEAKPFLGAEIRSKAELTYGRVRAKVRFANAPAVVSSLVTIYTPWPADNWNELDIELLGQDPTEVQFNTMVYTGEPTQPPVTESVKPTQTPYMETLGFDASTDFHEYTIEWTPDHATFWIDGQQRYEWSESIHLMTLPQNVLLTIWASDTASWAGAVAPETTGATVTYDWVELWEYTGPAPAPTTTATGTNATGTNATGTNATEAATLPGSTDAPSGATDSSQDSSASDSSSISETGATAQDSTSETTASFQLLFRDDFDQLDTSRWELMTHSWDSNLALFSADSVTVSDGFVTLTLLSAPSGTVDDTGASKAFLGAEVRSTQTIAFGRVRARAKFARAPAVVSSLVTIYTPWPADDWNELDIEHLGATPDQVQFNTMVYLGEPVTKPASTSVTPTQFPELVALGFDASAGFHEYEIEWTNAYVRFSVDGQPLHSFTEHVAKLGLDQNILLTIWASSSPEWAGAVTTETSGAQAVYDWIEVYEQL